MSRAIKANGRGRLEVAGDLTVSGETRTVVLDIVDVEGPTQESSDPWGKRRIGASATTRIRRSEFGMTWNNLVEAGGVLVGDEVSISLSTSGS